MFTIKAYSGSRQVIKVAESFTILRGEFGSAEITLHQKNPNEDTRIDVGFLDEGVDTDVPTFQRVVIENQLGKTTEIIQALMRPSADDTIKVGSATVKYPGPPRA